MLEAEKKEKLFLNFQRKQAQANREHELLMARLLLQARINQPSTSAYIGPSSFSGASGFKVFFKWITQPPFIAVHIQQGTTKESPITWT